MRVFIVYDSSRMFGFTNSAEALRMYKSDCEIAHIRGEHPRVRDIDVDMGNSVLIAETYRKYAHHQLGIRDPYLIRVLFALIGLPETCPACRCYELSKTSDGQWCCANCKRTMLDCIEEGLIK